MMKRAMTFRLLAVCAAFAAAVLTGCATTMQVNEKHIHRFVILEGTFCPVGSFKPYSVPPGKTFEALEAEGKTVYAMSDEEIVKNKKNLMPKDVLEHFFWDAEFRKEDLIHGKKAKAYGVQFEKNRYAVIEVKG